MTKKSKNLLFAGLAAALGWFIYSRIKNQGLTPEQQRDFAILNAQKSGYNTATRGRGSDPTAPSIPGTNPLPTGTKVLTDPSGKVLAVYN